MDRQTRKKYGQCNIPLRVQDMNNSDSDASSIELNEAEAQLRSFCHDNTLLEIHGIDDSQKGQVLGMCIMTNTCDRNIKKSDG